jgi:threonine dehydratase
MSVAAWNPEAFTLTSLDEIHAARDALPEVVRRTPVLPLARDAAEIGAERLFLKCECLQVTGAYKVRAAFNVMHRMPPDQRARGIVLTSSGNFAQAFAYAGRRMQVPIVVVMLDRTSRYKVEATRAHGAEVVMCGEDAAARQPTVLRVAHERGMTAIDTWEERPIIAGHGTIGLEILEQCPDVERVLVPVSSGGVAAGVAAAVKLCNPQVQVIGVQPERANAAWVSRRQGRPTAIDYWDSIADGLSAVRPGEFPFAHLQRYLDDIVLVSERDIAMAFRTLLLRAKLLSEPAGAVASAAFLAGAVDASRKTVAAVTGGNLTPETMHALLEMSR